MKKTVGVDDRKDRLDSLESDLTDMFKKMKMLRQVTFSREVIEHPVRGTEYYLYSHCDADCANEAWWFILGFVSARNEGEVTNYCRLYVSQKEEDINTEMYYRDITLPFVPVEGMSLDGIIEDGNDYYGDVRVQKVTWDFKLNQFEVSLETIKPFPLHSDWKVLSESTSEKWTPPEVN